MAAPHSISPMDKAIYACQQQIAGCQRYSYQEGALSGRLLPHLISGALSAEGVAPDAPDMHIE